MSPRTGRVADCRKDHDVKVRIGDGTRKKLLQYYGAHGITKAEAIWQGMHLALQQK